MQNKINLVMPMGGEGIRFFNNGYITPKPLLEINGRPFFYWATQSIRKFIDIETLIFVVLQDHIEKYQIDKKIYSYYPQAQIISLDHVLGGAVLTCEQGVRAIENELPIVFNDCDHLFRSSAFNEFCNEGKFKELDGALLSFSSKDPKFSFLKYDVNGFVTETVEKQVISNSAICGAYYFRNRNIFEEAVKEYLNVCSYSEFFVSGLYNVMSKNNMKIKSFLVDFHLPFGTPEEYELAINSKLFSEVI